MENTFDQDQHTLLYYMTYVYYSCFCPPLPTNTYFYSKYQSLYTYASICPSKRFDFYSDFIFWVLTVHQGGAKLEGGWIQMGDFVQVCAMQSWSKIFIAPTPISNPMPILVPGSISFHI